MRYDNSDQLLSPEEESVMKATFKATMLRAAQIVERITANDVLGGPGAFTGDRTNAGANS